MAIWFKTPTIASFNSILTNTLASHLGIRVTSLRGQDGMIPAASH